MSQFPHDEFVKEYLPELYQEYGEVTPSVDVKSERREIDVFFVPTKPVPTTPETLGLLGKLGQKPCLLEVYRNPVSSEQIRECVSKLLDVQQSQLRQARREKKGVQSNQLPILWIITPTISERILREFQAQPRLDWEKGIYFLAEGLYTGIVAVHQLVVSKQTLWLRILGKGKVQLQAIEELKSLPLSFPHRENILELVYGLLEKLEANQRQKQPIIKEDETLIMSLRQLYRDKMAEIEKQGIQQGKLEGKLEGIQQGLQQGIQQNLKGNIISILQKRFDNVSSELVEQVNNINDTDRLQKLLLETVAIASITDFQFLLKN